MKSFAPSRLLVISGLCIALTPISHASDSKETHSPRPRESHASREAELKRKTPRELGELVVADPERSVLVHRLRVMGDKSAVPQLKTAFSKSESISAKLAIAAALVSLGEANGAAWEFLSAEATKSVEDTVPFPIKVDQKGNLIPRVYAEDFLAWCKQTGKTQDEGLEWALRTAPTAVSAAADSRDSRATSLLLKGLRSKNRNVALSSAKALARIGHPGAGKLILAEARTRPKEVAGVMAQFLACTADPEAQAAVSEFISDAKVVDELRRWAKGGKCSLILGE